jgi:hypothetical protein
MNRVSEPSISDQKTYYGMHVEQVDARFQLSGLL